MKYKISKEEYDKLDEAMQKLYGESGEAEYTLQVEGLEDTGALKRAKDREKEAKKEALKKVQEMEDKVQELSDQLEDIQAKGGKGKKDDDKMDTAWERKYQRMEEQYKKQVEDMQSAIRDMTVSTTAQSIAAKLAGDDAEIILPHIERRLRGEFKDGKALTTILDEDGEPSALTVDELEKEFLSNKRFSAIVIGSRGSGGGAGGDRNKGGGGGAPKKLNEMSATEEAQFANQNPDQYQKMLAEAGQQG